VGQLDFLDGEGAGSIVIASKDGRGRWVSVPSRRISPQVRSAWMSGTSSTEAGRWSSASSGPPRASSPETIDSHGSCGRASGVALSGAITS
jgi:hypothetical protein